MKKVLLFMLVTVLSVNHLFFYPVACATIVSTEGVSSYILLSQYEATLQIGEKLCLMAYSLGGETIRWKSTNSTVASVNQYGFVTAKKAGTTTVTAKTKTTEAFCIVTISPTTITLSDTHFSLEHGETKKLTATTSNHSAVSWKSSRKSVATIDKNGKITAKKPGETTITATADQSRVTCSVTVRQPDLTLSSEKISLYRTQSETLTATVSSGISPIWRSSKKSVATINNHGVVKAIKHGTTTITAKVDQTTVSCEVTVKQPTITLDRQTISIEKGKKETLTATVSSGVSPAFSSSNTSVATVTQKGVIYTHKKGTATIYAKEDGVTAKCKITVTP